MLNWFWNHLNSDLGSMFDESSVAAAWRLLTLPLVIDAKFEKGTWKITDLPWILCSIISEPGMSSSSACINTVGWRESPSDYNTLYDCVLHRYTHYIWFLYGQLSLKNMISESILADKYVFWVNCWIRNMFLETILTERTSFVKVRFRPRDPSKKFKHNVRINLVQFSAPELY